MKTATPATEEAATPPDRDPIMLACTRRLGGHGAESPRDTMAALAEELSQEEIADQYGSGTLIEQFETEVAALLGHEAAVFVPSGTMAQQIALRIWSERKHCRTVAFHPTCHLENYEQMGYRQLHDLHARLVGDPRRLITLEDLELIAEPIAVLLIELPQREIGGQLPSWEDLCVQTHWARDRGIALHLDGARLWESAPFYGRAYAEIAGLFDSAYVSFYKKLGGLAGAALVGDQELIDHARVWIRRHGGNLIHLYPYVASARLQLRSRLGRMTHYHERAIEVGRALCRVPGVRIAPDPPQAAMMHVYLAGNADAMVAESTLIAEQEKVALFYGLRPSDVPGFSSFELSIGDAADALTDVEIEAYFERIMRAGAAHPA